MKRGFSIPYIPILLFITGILIYFFGWMVLAFAAGAFILITAGTAIYDRLTHDKNCRSCNAVKDTLSKEMNISRESITTKHEKHFDANVNIRAYTGRDTSVLVNIGYTGDNLQFIDKTTPADPYGEASYGAFLYDEPEYYQAAISSILEKAKSGKANTHHFNNLGVLYWETGEPEKAIACFEESILLDLKNPVPYRNRGLYEDEQGNLETALENFSKAVAAKPEDYSLNLNNAYTLMKLKRPNDAIPFFLKSIELGFNNDIVSRNLSKAYEQIGDTDKARHYEQLANSLA